MGDTNRSLDALLDRLVVGGGSGHGGGVLAALYRDFAFDRASLLLRADEDSQNRRNFELRLRLAMHLAPRQAIDYDAGNPQPRWRLVRDYLVSVLGRDPSQAEGLAREVALVLDNWSQGRNAVATHSAFLMRRDGPYCATCHVRFDGLVPLSLKAQDEYKPYFTSPQELLAAEVDHVEAISVLGTNALDNLQLLCRLCNGGKGDGLGVETRIEAQHAGSPIGEVPVAHRARMLFAVIERDRRRCVRCEKGDDELTVRPLVALGGYLRSNLQALCTTCTGF